MSPALWYRAGAFVVSPDNLDPRPAGQSGFGWLALLGADGPQRSADLARHADRVRAAGLDVVVWTVLRDRPEAEAELAAELCAEANAVGYIANAEAEHKGDSGGLQARSQAFVSSFRARLPDLPAALSTFGAAFAPFVLGHVEDPVRGPMDFGPWFRSGFHLLPQAYFNEEEVYAVGASLEHAGRAGWPAGRVHLTLGTYEGRRGRIPADDYVRELRDGGANGFSLYTAEQTALDDWPVYAHAVEEGLALARNQELPEPEPARPQPKPDRARERRRAMTRLAQEQIGEWRAAGVTGEKIRTFRIWKALEQLDPELAEGLLAD